MRFVYQATQLAGEVFLAIVDEESDQGTCVRYRVRWDDRAQRVVRPFE